MKIFKQLARVRMAQMRMALARQQVGRPAGALLARGREYPLTTVGVAAGAGFALGSLNLQPLRVPGLASVFDGGVAQAVAYGTRMLAELATLGVAVHAAGTETAATGEGDDVSS